jgi:hypothetical protein
MNKIRRGTAAFIKNAAATVALQKRLSSLDGDQGDKKQAEIMIEPFSAGRGQAAVRTGPRLILDLDFLRLHSANEDEGPPPLESPGILNGFIPPKQIIYYHSFHPEAP